MSVRIYGRKLYRNKKEQQENKEPKYDKSSETMILKTLAYWYRTETPTTQHDNATAYLPKDISKMISVFAIRTQETDELIAYALYLNHLFAKDADLQYMLPIIVNSQDILRKLRDGVMLAKLLHLIEPDAIDMRAVHLRADAPLNEQQRLENQTLSVTTAKSLGTVQYTVLLFYPTVLYVDELK